MNEAEALNVIDGIFDELKNIQVLHSNQEYSGTDEEWIRVSTQTSKSYRTTMGDNPIYRYFGICFVQVFVKPDTGEGRALEIVDMITPLIRDQNIQGIQFFVPRVIRVGVLNGWYQINVLTDFYRED